MINFDTNKNLRDLCSQDWSDDNIDFRFIQLCYLPVKDLKQEDLQNLLPYPLLLEFVIPLSITLLLKDPFDDLYHSLLCDLLRVSSNFWETHPHWRSQVESIFQTIWSTKETIRQTLALDLVRAHLMFNEFGPIRAKINDFVISHDKKYLLDYILDFLAIIASRKAIPQEEALYLMCDASCINPSRIEILIKEHYIQAKYEGPYPSPLILRLTKEFRNNVGLGKK